MIDAIITEVQELKNIDISQLNSVLALLEESKVRGVHNFYEKIIHGELEKEEIKKQCKELGIDRKLPRSMHVISCIEEEKEQVKHMMETLYFADKNTSVMDGDGEYLILIKAHKEPVEGLELEEIAHTLVDTIGSELMVSVKVAYGSLYPRMEGLKEAYMEGVTALEVGSRFYPNRRVLQCHDLGMGRLIHQVSKELSQVYLKDVLRGKGLDSFDEETMIAVHKFLQNNLNISETARQLYVHRNTLVYRLEKIQKVTGLDVRYFEDAMTFKIAMMVSEHLKNL